MIHQYQPRRSMLYVSGAVERHMFKSRTLAADSLIFDLHETVYPSSKAEARAKVARFLNEGGFQGQEIVVRVNALGSGWLEDDLKVFAGLPVNAFLFPAIRSAQDVKQARQLLNAAGGKHLPMMVMIDTLIGVMHAEEIAAAEETVNCLVMNTNRIIAELGIQPTADRIGLVYHLSRVILAARTWNKSVIDGAHLDLREAQSCEYSCRQGRDIGFDGKTVVHPVQLAYTNDAFTPRPKEIKAAQELIATMEEVRARGESVTMIGGCVITEDIEESARYTLEVASSIDERIKTLEENFGKCA